MIRRPPRSTRTDTLFPYTTLFRSERDRELVFHRDCHGKSRNSGSCFKAAGTLEGLQDLSRQGPVKVGPAMPAAAHQVKFARPRSEERRVGKEGVSTCRSRWSPDH